MASSFWNSVGEGLGNIGTAIGNGITGFNNAVGAIDSDVYNWLAGAGHSAQVDPEYTAAQQAAAETAYGNAASVLNNFSSDSYNNAINYFSNLNSLSSLTDTGALSAYQAYAGASTSNAAGSIMDAAELESTAAARKAAETYNLYGNGALYSGGALSAIAEGAAQPIADAEAQIAGLQSNAYNTALSANLSANESQNSALASLYSSGISNDASIASVLASVYANQASNYDTEAMYTDSWLSNLLGKFGSTALSVAGAAGIAASL